MRHVSLRRAPEIRDQRGPLRRHAATMLAAGIVALSGQAAAQDATTLKSVWPFHPDHYLSKPLGIFKETVEKRTNGRVKINILGGEEVVPSLQQFDALRNGVVDAIVGVTSYYSGSVPEGMALLYTRQVPSAQRKAGFYDLMRKIHLDKGGVIYLAHAGGTPGTGFRLYLRKKVEKADFTGLKIRVSPVYTALVQQLGGTPVSIPFADTYTALERGVADGFGSTYAGITQYALHEVSKYVVDHPFYSLNQAILVNKRVYESLPKALQDQLESIAVDYEVAVEQYMANFIKGEDELLKSKGMQFIRFSPEDAKKYLDVAYSSGWKEFVEKNREHGATIKALAEK